MIKSRRERAESAEVRDLENARNEGEIYDLVDISPRPYNRRPRRPPFLRVESEGTGVTSSIRPILIPARAKARRADWAPGPGVLVPVAIKRGEH